MNFRIIQIQNKMIRFAIICLYFLATVLNRDLQQDYSPENIQRIRTIWRQCECGTGDNDIELWNDKKQKIIHQIKVGTIKWIRFQQNTKNIYWKCNNMQKIKRIQVDLNEKQWLSILIFNTNKTSHHACNKQTGKISINIWNTTEYISSVPFTSHTEGYACFKIPTILKTQKNTLIAFSQARFPGCDDFDKTELVYKRSFDQGRTWSSLRKLVNQTNETGLCGHKLVIGNISPVQLINSKKYPGRILAPYTRNNHKLWITYSDDDGQTWHSDRQIPNLSQTNNYPDCNRNSSYFGLNIDQLKFKNIPDFILFFNQLCKLQDVFKKPQWTMKLKAPWEFIGIGPSQGIQLKSGRIIIPGYNSPIRGVSQVPGVLPSSQLFNNFAKGFVLISDDEGDTWRRGQQWFVGNGANQHQVVQLNDGSILSNSRSFSTGSPQYRIQARSFNDGESFTSTQFTSIPQPFNGCQGSTIVGNQGKVYVVSPNPKNIKSLAQRLINSLNCKTILNGRQNLSLWESRDNGHSYQLKTVIDPGLSAQSSLVISKNKLFILHQQSDPDPASFQNNIQEQAIQNLKILLPSRFVYRQIKLS